MILERSTPLTWRRLAVTFLLIAVAVSLRFWPLQSLKTTLTWLTFYPAVMINAPCSFEELLTRADELYAERGTGKNHEQ